jgi:death-on-curing protein
MTIEPRFLGGDLLNSIAINHPFLDGNKRTALASSLTFLFMNGYEIEESY